MIGRRFVAGLHPGAGGSLARAFCLAFALVVAWPVTGEAAFPGTNGTILFSRGPGISAMDADGSHKRRLTHPNASVFEGQASVSPDGTQIVFARGHRKGGAIRTDIYVMNADGTHRRRITRTPAFEGDPAFSPDGQRIVFDSARRGSYSDIYVMNSDGSDRRRLTATEGNDDEPVFSPDGATIAYTGAADIDNINVYLMDADGTHQRNITGRPGHDDFSFHPDFSPDGQRIILTRVEPTFDLYSIRTDGADAINLTPFREDAGVGVYSPDGTQIAYTREIRNSDVYVMRADGSGQRNLTPGKRPASLLDWGPAPE